MQWRVPLADVEMTDADILQDKVLCTVKKKSSPKREAVLEIAEVTDTAAASVS